tara:strand:- start:9410 stop:9595 length:186 start_codon:yes stop_codon:yes gene_type:complete
MGATILQRADYSHIVAPKHNRLIANIYIERLVIVYFFRAGRRPPNWICHLRLETFSIAIDN